MKTDDKTAEVRHMPWRDVKAPAGKIKQKVDREWGARRTRSREQGGGRLQLEIMCIS